MQLAGKNILIIGATGVLGATLARLLIEQGASVIGTARSNESAANLPTGLTQALLLDLDSPASIDVFVSYALSSSMQLDGVIVASGLVAFGTIEQTPADVATRLMTINHLAPARVLSALLPLLAQSQYSPFIASISGVVAEKVFPGMAAYTASKTAHSTWLKALALEVRRGGIRVVDARPGHTETGLATRAIFGTSPAFPTGMTAQHVAQVIVSAIIEDKQDLPSEAFAQ